MNKKERESDNQLTCPECNSSQIPNCNCIKKRWKNEKDELKINIEENLGDDTCRKLSFDLCDLCNKYKESYVIKSLIDDPGNGFFAGYYLGCCNKCFKSYVDGKRYQLIGPLK